MRPVVSQFPLRRHIDSVLLAIRFHLLAVERTDGIHKFHRSNNLTRSLSYKPYPTSDVGVRTPNLPSLLTGKYHADPRFIYDQGLQVVSLSFGLRAIGTGTWH